MATIKRSLRRGVPAPASAPRQQLEVDDPLHSLSPDRDLLLAQHRTACEALVSSRLVGRVVSVAIAVVAFGLNSRSLPTDIGIAYTGLLFCALWAIDARRKSRTIQVIERVLISADGSRESFADDYIRFRHYAEFEVPFGFVLRLEPALWALIITMGAFSAHLS